MNTTDMAARLWNLLLSQPNLLATHMSYYATLMRNEAELAMASLRYRIFMGLICVGCSLLFVGLLGVALLLWGTAPEQTHPHAWVLWGVPCVPLLGAICSLFALLRKPSTPLWSVLQTQISTDVALLKNNVS
jgi:hypothetical protein